MNDPTPEFLEWMEQHDRERESIDAVRGRRAAFYRDNPPEVQRHAFELRMAAFPGITSHR